MVADTEPSVPEAVMVPKALLARTLRNAEGDLWASHQEFCTGSERDPDGVHCCNKQQTRIDQLCLIAGIDLEEVDLYGG